MGGTRGRAPDAFLVFELDQRPTAAEAGAKLEGQAQPSLPGTLRSDQAGKAPSAMDKEGEGVKEPKSEIDKAQLETFASEIAAGLEGIESKFKFKEKPKVMGLIEKVFKQDYYEKIKNTIMVEVEKIGSLEGQDALSVTSAIVERYLQELPTAKQTNEGWEDRVIYLGSCSVLTKLKGDLDAVVRANLDEYLKSEEFWRTWQNLMAVVYAHNSPPPQTEERARRLIETIYFPENPEILQNLKNILAAPRTSLSNSIPSVSEEPADTEQKQTRSEKESTSYIG